MRKLSQSEKELICKLYKKGESSHTLSEKIGVNHRTVLKWLRKASIEPRSYSQAHKLAYVFGRNPGRRKRILETSKKLTPAKAYILGVVGLGDGCISISTDKSWNIGMSSKDIEFINEFARCVKEVYGFDCSIRTIKQGREAFGAGNSIYVAGLYSKEVVDDILRYGEYKHFKHHTGRVPNAIKEADLGIKSAYLRAFFDSQGSLQKGKNRCISAIKADERSVDEIAHLLSTLGIRSKIYSRLDKKYGVKQWTLVISRRKFIERFAKLIGFTIERKKRILNEMLKTYVRGYYRLRG